MKLNKTIQILLLFLFVINVSQGLFSPILAVFVTNFVLGATLKTIGFAVAFYSITKSIIQVPLARRLDKKIGEKDDFYTMLLGATISIIYSFGFLFIKSPLHFYILSIIGGTGAASAQQGRAGRGACDQAVQGACMGSHCGTGPAVHERGAKGTGISGEKKGSKSDSCCSRGITRIDSKIQIITRRDN